MVDGTVVQGMVDPELVEGVAVIHPSADKFIGRNMAVGIHETEDVIVVQAVHILETGNLGQVIGRAVISDGGVEFGFRVSATSVAGRQGETVVVSFQLRGGESQTVVAGGE